MGKMIGKPVSGDELKKVLDGEKDREEFRKRFEAELKAIKPGECLLYESKVGRGSFTNLGVSLFIGQIKGLKMITEGDKTYIYREK